MQKCRSIKRGPYIKLAITVAIVIVFSAALASICDDDSLAQDQPWIHPASASHIYESLLLALRYRNVYAVVDVTAFNPNSLILYLELQEKSPPPAPGISA